MYKRIITIIFFVGLNVIFFIYGLESSTLKPDTVIAEVEGKKILYKEISYEDFRDMVINVEERELMLLKTRIEDIVKLLEGQKRNIKISEREVKERINFIDSICERAGINNKTIESLASKLKLIADALEKWQRNPEQSENIFNNYLKDKISHEEWEIHKKVYNTLEKIKNFRTSIPNSLEDIRNKSYKSTYNDLLHEKLFNIITNNIEISETEIREYYNWKYPLIEYFEVLHIFHQDESILKKIVTEIQNQDELSDVARKYRLEISNKSGYQKEKFFFDLPLPFYTKGLYDLKIKDFDEIYYGALIAQWPNNKIPDNLEVRKNYYHTIQLIGLVRKSGEIPSYDIVKNELQNELLKKKKYKYYQEWLNKSINKTKIHIFIDKYKKIFQLLK